MAKLTFRPSQDGKLTFIANTFVPSENLPSVLRTFAGRVPLPGRPLPDRSLLWGAVTRLNR